MPEYDKRLLTYDQASSEERKALLNDWFPDKETQKLFKTISENQLIRALLEFRELGVVPYEDFVRLKKKGLVDNRSNFCSYVPVVRGKEFPDARLTQKGERLKVLGVRDYGTEQLTYEPFRAYRVRETGNGVVANRETLEEWLDTGNEDCLMLLVDPDSGNRLEDTVSDNLDFFTDICAPECRDQLIRNRHGKQVSTASPRVNMIYSPGFRQFG